jgi:hypothetical protein
MTQSGAQDERGGRPATAAAARSRFGAQASIFGARSKVIIDQFISISQLPLIVGVPNKVIIDLLILSILGFCFTTLTGSGTAATTNISFTILA